MNFKKLIFVFAISFYGITNCDEHTRIKKKPINKVVLSESKTAGLIIGTTAIALKPILSLRDYLRTYINPRAIVEHPKTVTIITLSIATLPLLYVVNSILNYSDSQLFNKAVEQIEDLNFRLLETAKKVKSNNKEFLEDIKRLYVSSRYYLLDAFEDIQYMLNECLNARDILYNIAKKSKKILIINKKTPSNYLKLSEDYSDFLASALNEIKKNPNFRKQKRAQENNK